MNRGLKRVAEEIVEAEKFLRIAEEILGKGLVLTGETKLLAKALENCEKSAKKVISAFIHYDYILGKIEISETGAENIELFFERSGVYGLSKTKAEEIRKLLKTAEKHKKSAFEFTKNGKLVIMDDEHNQIRTVTVKKIKKQLVAVEKLIDLSKLYFRRQT